MKKKIKEIILNCLEELSQEMDDEFEVSVNTIIFGPGGVLDSLDFVNLVMEIEEAILDEFDKNITILSDVAFSKSKSPFRNVESLTEYIFEMIGSEE